MSFLRHIHILAPFFRQRWPIYSLGLFTLIIVDLLQTVIPKLTGRAVDLLAARAAAGGALLWIVAIALGIAALRYFYRECIMGSTRHLEFYLRKKLFSHALRLPLAYFDRQGPGKIMALSTSDVNAVRTAIGLGAILFVDAIVMGVASLAFMAGSINPELTWQTILPLPFILAAAAWLGRPVHHSFRRVQESFASLTEFTQETFSGAKVIKGFAAEGVIIDRFAAVSRENVAANMTMARLQAVYMPLTHIAPLICYAIAIYRGGQLVIAGVITIGDLAAFIGYLGLIIWPVMGIGYLINTIQRGGASLARLDALLSEPVYEHRLPGEPGQLPGAGIVISNLDFKYPSGTDYALRGINLTIPAGSTVGIVGRTGSGKSTLLKLLLRLYDAAPGAIHIGGREIHAIDCLTLRHNIGYVPQEGLLFSRAIGDNIAFDREYPREAVVEAARLAAVHEDIDVKPFGFETVLAEKGRRLSGGQQQRVAIARALVKKPPLLLLDDVFSALDYRTQGELLANMKKISAGRTVVIVSQRVAAVRDADLIAVLDKGRVAEQGTHQELVARGGLYCRLYEQQLANGDGDG